MTTTFRKEINADDKYFQIYLSFHRNNSNTIYFRVNSKTPDKPVQNPEITMKLAPLY